MVGVRVNGQHEVNNNERKRHEKKSWFVNAISN